MDSQTPAPQHHASQHPTNGLAVTSLVLGILAFLTGIVYVAGLFGIPAIILGIIGMKKPGGKGMSIAGIILGALGTITSVVVIILSIIGIGLIGREASKVSNSYDDYKKEQQDTYKNQTAGKKDFDKGETAKFGDLAVKIDKVTRNYVPTSEFERADAGKELIVLDLSVTNKGGDSVYVSDFDFKVDENGLREDSAFAKTPGKEFESGQLAVGATTSGQIVYEVSANAQNLKLVHEANVINPNSYVSEKVTYSLAF